MRADGGVGRTYFGGGVGEAVERRRFARRRFAHERDERVAGHGGCSVPTSCGRTAVCVNCAKATNSRDVGCSKNPRPGWAAAGNLNRARGCAVALARGRALRQGCIPAYPPARERLHCDARAPELNWIGEAALLHGSGLESASCCCAHN